MTATNGSRAMNGVCALLPNYCYIHIKHVNMAANKATNASRLTGY